MKWAMLGEKPNIAHFFPLIKLIFSFNWKNSEASDILIKITIKDINAAVKRTA